jgi:hypothetical protein
MDQAGHAMSGYARMLATQPAGRFAFLFRGDPLLSRQDFPVIGKEQGISGWSLT